MLSKEFKIENYVPRPYIPVANTNPPQIIDLKFRGVTDYINDGLYYGFDTVEISFAFLQGDMDSRSAPTMYHFDIEDLETGIRKGYLMKANDRPYIYWQKASTVEPEEIEEVENGIVNARIYITPINDFGKGPTSSFLMPMKNLKFISRWTLNLNPAHLILSKYWHLFSVNPEEKFNRPKTIHIYMDVADELILLDKEKLSQDDYAVNCIGNWKEVNNQLFRWVIGEESNRKLDPSNNFIEMTEEENTFISLLLDSINDRYYTYLNSAGIRYGEPHVFKIAVMNPRDHDDSIIIYLMKGKRWEM
jgi:hypothetical protein